MGWVEPRSQCVAKLLFVAVGVGIAAAGLVLLRVGSLNPSRADDWSYVSTAMNEALGLDLRLNGWVHMFFLGQGWAGAVVVKAFGEPFVTLRLLVLFIGVIGLISTFVLAAKLLSFQWSLLVLLIIGLGPLWLHLSVSFMTDIPMWTLALISVLLVFRGVGRNQTAWFVLAGVLGLAAFSVREYGVIPVIVMLALVPFRRSKRRLGLGAVAVIVVVVGLAIVAYQWRVGLPGSVITEALPQAVAVGQVSRLLLTLGLFLAPAMAIAGIVVRPTGERVLKALRVNFAGAFLGSLAAVSLFAVSGQRLVGNVIHPYGSSWTSVGDGVRAVPGWFYTGLVLVAFLSALVLCVGVGIGAQRALKSREWLQGGWWTWERWTAGALAAVAIAMLGASIGAVLFVGAPVFDRYLLLPVTLLTIVMFCWALRHQGLPKVPGMKWWVGAVVAVSTAVGIIFVDASNQVDGLRWKVSEELVAQGIPAHSIDGGDAWFRFHQRNVPGVEQIGSLENSIPGRTWWQTFFEGSTFCRMVAIESETDLQAMFGPALSVRQERTLLGIPFRVMVFPGPDPC